VDGQCGCDYCLLDMSMPKIEAFLAAYLAGGWIFNAMHSEGGPGLEDKRYRKQNFVLYPNIPMH